MVLRRRHKRRLTCAKIFLKFLGLPPAIAPTMVTFQVESGKQIPGMKKWNLAFHRGGGLGIPRRYWNEIGRQPRRQLSFFASFPWAPTQDSALGSRQSTRSFFFAPRLVRGGLLPRLILVLYFEKHV